MLQTANSSSRTDYATHRQILDAIAKDLPFAEGLVISSLPRGGLQIVQPQKVNESIIKLYGREFHTEDDASWKAILSGNPARANHSGRYVREFLSDFGFTYAVAVPIQAPVFEGYPGAIQLLRTTTQGDFSDAEVRKIADIVKKLDRPSTGSANQFSWEHRPTLREMVFDGNAKVRAFASAFDELDERVQDQIMQEVRKRLSRKNNDTTVTSNRLLLPDSHGDHWIFNAVIFPTYPALGSGQFVFVCMLPTCPEWGDIRPADFQADPELSRLVPAMKFMHQEYYRGPTLVEISKQLHLSPFHFHRRFTELMGLTPKHFLLECQIHDAKGELVSGKKELAQIAADCGFAHQSHFTSRFKQATGLTPTRWRRMALGKASEYNSSRKVGNGKSHR